MAAYILSFIKVIDAKAFQQYGKEVPSVIEKFGGRFLVRGGAMTGFEGKGPTERFVVVEFPSMEHVQTFWNSPEYQATKRRREGICEMRIFAVEGV
ncbi:MAG: DUF1330 domain-containing protein [Rhodospirillales bacterium]|nr:DUF1330 domain-containing protein [Rhodospirillales bacterium]